MTLSNEDILDVVKILVELRNGQDVLVGQGHGAFGRVAAHAGVELHPTHA